MMYSVVQLIEKNKFKVIAVPSTWVRKNSLLWPKLSNSKIEALRVTGQNYDGPTRKIPVIVFKKFKNLQMAEDAAEELSKREVSDVDNKRKRLKPTRAPKMASSKDYNLMVQECVRTKRKILSETNAKPAAEHHESNPKPVTFGPIDNFYDENVHPTHPTELLRTSPVHTKASRTLKHQTDSLRLNPTVLVQPDATFSSSNAPCTSTAAAEFMHVGSEQLVHSGVTMQLTPPIHDQHSEADVVLSNLERPSVSYNQAPTDQVATSTKLLTVGMSPTQSIQIDSEQVYVNQDEIMYFTPTIDTDPMASLQIAGAMSYEQMKADLKEFIEATVEKVVEKCFETHFARFAALSEIQRREDSVELPARDSVERHARINTEEELKNWNIELNSKELCQKYREYFSKIIIPNAYNGKGDNACYTIVDCLFTRDFWTKMTWTGISRGNKAKQGFREFGNVTQLLCSIVQIGDPSYTAKKLEMFCRNRLFRYSKFRSTNRQLRRSACRKRRGTKAVINEESIPAEQPDETTHRKQPDETTETDQSESMEDYSSDEDSGGNDDESNEGGLEN